MKYLGFIWRVLRRLVWETATDQTTGLAAQMAYLLLFRSEEHTSELQSQSNLVCRLLLEKKKKTQQSTRPLRSDQPPSATPLPASRPRICRLRSRLLPRRTRPRRPSPDRNAPALRSTTQV